MVDQDFRPKHHIKPTLPDPEIGSHPREAAKAAVQKVLRGDPDVEAAAEAGHAQAAFDAVGKALEGVVDFKDKYSGLREQIIGNGEAAAKQFHFFADKYRKMAAEYEKLATHTMDAAVKAADNHIKDLMRLDRAVAALDDPDDTNPYGEGDPAEISGT